LIWALKIAQRGTFEIPAQPDPTHPQGALAPKGTPTYLYAEFWRRDQRFLVNQLIALRATEQIFSYFNYSNLGKLNITRWTLDSSRHFSGKFI
jgi:hypothetical protein